jgi:hypothetical protein
MRRDTIRYGIDLSAIRIIKLISTASKLINDDRGRCIGTIFWFEQIYAAQTTDMHLLPQLTGSRSKVQANRERVPFIDSTRLGSNTWVVNGVAKKYVVKNKHTGTVNREKERNQSSFSDFFWTTHHC